MRGKSKFSYRHKAKIEAEINLCDFRPSLETNKSKICATSRLELKTSKVIPPKEARTSTQESALDVIDNTCNSAENEPTSERTIPQDEECGHKITNENRRNDYLVSAPESDLERKRHCNIDDNVKEKSSQCSIKIDKRR